MNRSLAGVLTLAAVVPLAAGCAMNKGAVSGNATGSAVRGAISGAAVGGVAGALVAHQMDKQAEELAYELPGARVQRVGEGIAVTFPDGLLFRFDSDQLAPAARDNLRTFAASLKKYPNTRTLIVGHTDSDGSAEYNMDLSNRRALSAASFLSLEGVDRARICAAGRGQAEPIAANSSDAGRRQNRRVEIAIYANDATRSGSGN
jgi:outer membrane protein OmpA-like peptidoglycan-associated protein